MLPTYPADLPTTEALEIVSMVRNKEVAAKKAKFGYNLWVLQGFVQKSVLGDPNAPAVTPQNLFQPPANFNAVNELEKICQDQQAGTFHAQSAIPWKAILQWALAELTTVLLAA